MTPSLFIDKKEKRKPIISRRHELRKIVLFSLSKSQIRTTGGH